MKRAFDIAAGAPLALLSPLSALSGAFWAASNPIGWMTVVGVGMSALSLANTRLGWRAMTQGTDPAKESTTGTGRALDVAAGVPIAAQGVFNLAAAGYLLATGPAGAMTYGLAALAGVAGALFTRLGLKSTFKGTGKADPAAEPAPA